MPEVHWSDSMYKERLLFLLGARASVPPNGGHHLLTVHRVHQRELRVQIQA